MLLCVKFPSLEWQQRPPITAKTLSADLRTAAPFSIEVESSVIFFYLLERSGAGTPNL